MQTLYRYAKRPRKKHYLGNVSNGKPQEVAKSAK
jgi:hypothetical protein